tara:strand:- start:2690 stop:3667 length:978 start_codon:yes stop_codon:yes gene_type:complete
MTLKVENLSFFRSSQWILRNLCFSVENGECLTLLGPSGCGKSSTLRLIAGLDKVTEGNIFIKGKNITNIDSAKRRIGMVFQNYALFPHLNVYNNLSIGLKIRGDNKKDIRKKVENILFLVQIDNLSNRFPAELSGGQQQRVALARALLREPHIFLLDEPMSNLDAQLREELRPEIKKIVLSKNKPIVYVTHDQQEAMAMSNKLAVINNGMIEQIDTPEKIYKYPQSIFVASFVGTPQINIIKTSEKYITAIRPEDLKVSSRGVKAKIYQREWFGLNQLLILDTKFGKMKLLCKPDQEITEDSHLEWDASKEHRFDTITGKRFMDK